MRYMISGKDLVEYIINYFGEVNAKQLQKLAYLTELEYMKAHGERLTDLQFKKFYYGPYSDGIEEIKAEDDNIINTKDHDYIILKDKKVPLYTYKRSKLKVNNINLSPELKSEIDTILKKYKGKTGKELEEIADNTEPFLDVEVMGEAIDLNGYAKYYKSLLSDKFWEKAFKAREENEKKGVYGRRIIKNDSDLESFFS